MKIHHKPLPLSAMFPNATPIFIVGHDNRPGELRQGEILAPPSTLTDFSGGPESDLTPHTTEEEG